jgi:hypothetical protein
MGATNSVFGKVYGPMRIGEGCKKQRKKRQTRNGGGLGDGSLDAEKVGRL